jgi:hypothetical protein
MIAHPARETSPVSGPPVDAAMAAELHRLFRSFGATVTVVRAAGGFILEGVSPTYYGKQMAQEIARRADLVVLANRIRVVGPPAATR